MRPGAADDALGLAAMLEDARLFASGPRPQRTLVFAAWTGEERGLLGSEYYAQHPLFPMETMVANLTFDTLQWNGPVKDAVLVGRGQSSDMEACLADAAKAQGRYVTPENHPERGLFYRADHFSFAKRGVPVLLDMALAGAYDMAERRAARGREVAEASPPLAITRPAIPGRRAGTSRRRAGGGAVLRDRRPPREQPTMAAMERELGIREGAGAVGCSPRTGRRQGRTGTALSSHGRRPHSDRRGYVLKSKCVSAAPGRRGQCNRNVRARRHSKARLRLRFETTDAHGDGRQQIVAGTTIKIAD